MRPLALLAALFLIAAAPADFALRLPVEAAADAQLQRLRLPARALAASRAADLADVRIFDANARALPIARLAARRGRATTRLAALPILGRPGTLRLTGATLRLEGEAGARVATLDGAVEAGPDATVLGVLFDTRAVRSPAVALTLDADVPAMQPVRFIVDASRDLTQWRPIAEAVAYRAVAGQRDAPIDLGGADVKGDYLRVRWRADAPLIGPVVVRGGVLATAPAAAPPTPARVRVLDSRRDGDRALEFALPFGGVAAIAVTPGDAAAVVPVRVLGRADREAPWRLIGQGTLYRVANAGRRVTGAPIAIDAGDARLLRVEADARGGGLGADPRVELVLAPVEIAWVASGAPPYALAVGKADAEPAWLPGYTLSPDGVDAATLPLARVAGGDPAVTLRAAPPADGVPPRTLLLWAVLLGGTATLGLMVWRLTRTAPPG